MPRSPKIDRRELLAIFAGGCLGGLLRAALSDAFVPEPGAWPWPTFAVNIVGAVLLGYFVTGSQGRPLTTMYRRSLLGTGFCGALTTFATLQLELLGMLDAGRLVLAAAYVAASLAAGLAGVHLASSLTRRQRARA